jgi:hypothetical protein
LSSQLLFGSAISKDDLVHFYSTRDPSKISSVDRILAHYSVAELVKLLVAKYGEAPPVGRDYAALLGAFFKRHNPPMVPKVGEVLTKYAGQEKALLQRLYDAQVGLCTRMHTLARRARSRAQALPLPSLPLRLTPPACHSPTLRRRTSSSPPCLQASP